MPKPKSLTPTQTTKVLAAAITGLEGSSHGWIHDQSLEGDLRLDVSGMMYEPDDGTPVQAVTLIFPEHQLRLDSESLAAAAAALGADPKRVSPSTADQIVQQACFGEVVFTSSGVQ